MTTTTIEERFWSKVNKAGPVIRPELGPCWLWTASIGNIDEYGRFWMCGKFWIAHNVAWVITNHKIPAGEHVLHKCDTPLCVNPAHLFTGSAKVNHADMTQKGRQRKRGGSESKIQLWMDAHPEEVARIAEKHGLKEGE